MDPAHLPRLTFFSGGSLKVRLLTDEAVPLIPSSCFPPLLSSGAVGSQSSFFLFFKNASREKRWTRGRSDGERSVVESGLRAVVMGGGREGGGLSAHRSPVRNQRGGHWRDRWTLSTSFQTTASAGQTYFSITSAAS